MKNAAVYARYSSGPNQSEQSIEGQIRECAKYAETHDLRIVEYYVDRKISGRTDNRREFQRMIEDSGKGLFEAVIVYHTDRFARSRYDSAIYKKQLRQNGIELCYATGDLPKGPESIILESVMEGWAEYYSAELSRKIKRGMRESALKCHSTGAGHTLGYKTAPDKSFIIDEEGAQAVRAVFEMYVKGESQTAICDYLNGLGFRTVRGKPFNKSSVTHIIKNRRYIGTYTYDDIVIEDGIPPIVSKDIFQLAQQELIRRRTAKRPAGPQAEYLLSGKLFCGHCGNPATGVSGTSGDGIKYYYYYCKATRGKNKTCKKKPVSRDRLEELVVEETVKHILQPDVIKRIAERCYATQLEQRGENSDVLFYKRRLADIKKAIKNTMRAIETGAKTKLLPQRLAELEGELEQTEAELAVAKARNILITPDQIEFMLFQFARPLESETWSAYKKKIIKCFVNAVWIYDDKLLIRYTVGASGKEALGSELPEAFDQSDFASTSLTAGRMTAALIIKPYCLWLVLNMTAQDQPMRPSLL